MSKSPSRHRALIAAFAAIGVSALAAGTASAATVSANIAYTTHASDLACDDPTTPAGTPTCHIAVLNTDGVGREVTNGASNNDVDPAWSPDGTKLAFARNGGAGYDIYTMNADGSHQVKLTSDPRDDRYPTWSPDGSRIAYRGYGTGTGSRIFLVAAGGGTATPIPGTNGGDQPAFSPDGTRIAFTASTTPAGGTPNDDIFVIDTAGGTPRNVTNSQSTSDRYPAWYPSGNRIAFRRFTPPPAAPSPRQLFTIDCVDNGCRGGGAPSITDLSPQLGDGRAASWSPDAKYLTFVSYRDADRDAEIWIGSLDGTTLRPRAITSNAINDDEPRWANVPASVSPVPVSGGGTTPTNANSSPGATKPAGGTVTVGGGLVNGRRALGLSLLVPRQTLKRHKTLRAYVRCTYTCTVTGTAKAKVRTGKKAKTVRLYKVRKKARANRRTRIAVRIPAKALRSVRGTLKRHRKVVITLSLSARTAAGEFTPAATSRLTLRR